MSSARSEAPGPTWRGFALVHRTVLSKICWFRRCQRRTGRPCRSASPPNESSDTRSSPPAGGTDRRRVQDVVGRVSATTRPPHRLPSTANRDLVARTQVLGGCVRLENPLHQLHELGPAQPDPLPDPDKVEVDLLIEAGREVLPPALIDADRVHAQHVDDRRPILGRLDPLLERSLRQGSALSSRVYRSSDV